MAVNYSTAVKNDRMTQVLNAIDGGAGAGKLEIGDSGMATVLVTFTLPDPSGSVSNGVLTFDAISDATASASGTAAEARIRDSADTDVVTGLTVGTSGTDVVLDSTSISVDQTVSITSASLTHG